jgi:hypothetical protein
MILTPVPHKVTTPWLANKSFLGPPVEPWQALAEIAGISKVPTTTTTFVRVVNPIGFRNWLLHFLYTE